MQLYQDFLILFVIVIFCVGLFILAFPLKNWLEIERVRKKDENWSNWLFEKPTREEYCLRNNQSAENIECDYCNSRRQLPSLEMVIAFQPKFRLISNTFQKYSHFKAYICSGCETELYRERYEK